EELYAAQGLAVWTADSRGRLVSPRDSSEKGGSEAGGGGDGVALRKDFQAVAFHRAGLVTDAAGHAEVVFRLPDSVTRYRVMAVAASRGSDVGAGDVSVRRKN